MNVGDADVIRTGEDGEALEGVNKASSAINYRDSNSVSSGADNNQMETEERWV